jgi:mono/diheme cytochrome c family protein
MVIVHDFTNCLSRTRGAMLKKLLPLLVILIALLVAGCGSVATPVWEGGAETTPTVESEGVEVAQAEEETELTEVPPTEEPTVVPSATSTPIPSATPVPVTATPTSLPPTATATVIPTQTSAAVAEAGLTGAESTEASDSGAAGSAGTGDASAGEQLFIAGNGVAAPCSSCHMVNSDMTLVGPGMLGLGDRAGSRVPGQSAEEYLHNSIINPNEHIVAGFAAGLMPQNYAETLSEDEINNLVAYLLTL